MWWMQINTCNGFYCDQFTPNSAAKPKMWTENWSGWFLSFGGAVPYRPVEDLAFAVARFYQRGGTFQNYYMVITFFFFPFFSAPCIAPCEVQPLCQPCSTRPKMQEQLGRALMLPVGGPAGAFLTPDLIVAVPWRDQPRPQHRGALHRHELRLRCAHRRVR
jgi:hypothetical protein